MCVTPKCVAVLPECTQCLLHLLTRRCRPCRIAEPRPVVDRGAVPGQGIPRAVALPKRPHVHVRVRVLPGEGQPVTDFRGQPSGMR